VEIIVKNYQIRLYTFIFLGYPLTELKVLYFLVMLVDLDDLILSVIVADFNDSHQLDGPIAANVDIFLFDPQIDQFLFDFPLIPDPLTFS